MTLLNVRLNRKKALKSFLKKSIAYRDISVVSTVELRLNRLSNFEFMFEFYFISW